MVSFLGRRILHLTTYEGQDAHLQCSTLTNISICTEITWYRDYQNTKGVATRQGDEFIFFWQKDGDFVKNSDAEWNHWQISSIDGHIYTRNTSMADEGRFLCDAQCPGGDIFNVTDLLVKVDLNQILSGEYLKVWEN